MSDQRIYLRHERHPGGVFLAKHIVGHWGVLYSKTAEEKIGEIEAFLDACPPYDDGFYLDFESPKRVPHHDSDSKDAELSSLRAQLAEVTARLCECEGALEPMAAVARQDWPRQLTDATVLYQRAGTEGPYPAITLGNCRRAASLLRQPEPSGEGGPLAGARAQKGGE